MRNLLDPHVVRSRFITRLPDILAKQGITIYCTLREPGCLGSPCVFCHVRNKRALGHNKPHDTFGFYGCNHCHPIQEARRADWRHVCEAIYESQALMLQHGALMTKEMLNEP